MVLIILVAIVMACGSAQLLRSYYHRRMATACCPGGLCQCKALAEAEEIYRQTDHTGNNVLKYATGIQELEGKNGNPGLVERTLAAADLTIPNSQPQAGYLVKILLTQGPHASGGQYSYIDENGNMTRGYAFVACPGDYDSTGTLTYMISNRGILYRKDLGKNTHSIVETMSAFDPDSTWEQVK